MDILNECEQKLKEMLNSIQLMKKELLKVKEIPKIEIKDLTVIEFKKEYETRLTNTKILLSQLTQLEEINKFEYGISTLKKKLNNYIDLGYYTQHHHLCFTIDDYTFQSFIETLKSFGFTTTRKDDIYTLYLDYKN
jgi:hypothetical protein